MNSQKRYANVAWANETACMIGVPLKFSSCTALPHFLSASHPPSISLHLFRHFNLYTEHPCSWAVTVSVYTYGPHTHVFLKSTNRHFFLTFKPVLSTQKKSAALSAPGQQWMPLCLTLSVCLTNPKPQSRLKQSALRVALHLFSL